MNILLYNENITQQAGIDHPPETLQELVDQCLDIKNQGIMDYPMAWHLKGSERRIDWAWYIFGILYGGETLYDEDWNATYLDSESPGYKGLEFIIDCIYTHEIMDQAAVEWDTFKVVDMLMKGDAVFVPTDPFQFPNVNDPEVSDEAGNIKLALMPENNWTWAKTDQFSITKGCRDKGQDYYDAAWEFLQWFTGPEEDSMTYMYASEGLLMHSCYTSMNNDPDLRAIWDDYYNVTLLDEQAANALSLQDYSPAHITKFYLPWVNDHLIPNLQAAILQTKTISEALQAIDQGFQDLADEYGLPER
jgi:multiple sugar transport system substrate-binding protein